jgi:hypothetical protein
MDILFDDFNSAATYSGPAVLRLLRASCGQASNADLYRPGAKQCFLFENLKQLGYTDGLLLNHTGRFDNMLGLLRDGGRLQAEASPFGELRPALTGFGLADLSRSRCADAVVAAAAEFWLAA